MMGLAKPHTDWNTSASASASYNMEDEDDEEDDDTEKPSSKTRKTGDDEKKVVGRLQEMGTRAHLVSY